MSLSSGGATMEDIFHSFCAFGGGLKDSRPSMDGSKFGKFCRDTKIIDKKLTSTDVDIIFAQVKGKTERKISFDQFMDAIHVMAEKKYTGEKNATFLLQSKIMEGKGPSISGTTKSIKSDAVERMTDAAQYTGTHKERFDEGGKGRGAAGRDSTPKGRASVPGSLIGSQPGYVSGYKGEGKYSIGGGSSPSSSPSTKKRDSGSVVTSVTDRLTDTSKYTGAHKHRFDETGHGLGIAGRDAPVKGHGMSPGNVGGQTSYVHGYKNEGSFGKK